MAFQFGVRLAAWVRRWDIRDSRRWLAALLLICGVALLARLGAALVLRTPVESDSEQYLCMARNLVEAARLEDCDHNLALYSAGYPLFLGGFFALFGVHLWVAYAANLLLGALSVVLAGLVARELTRSPLAGLCAAALLALYLEAILYTDYLAKENLVIPILLLQLWLVLRWRRWHPHALAPLLLGATIAAQALAGVTSLAILPALVAFLVLSRAARSTLLRDAVLVTVAAALCIAPWLLRNERVIGAPVLNTNGGVNLYLGNNANAGIMFMKIWDTPVGKDWHALHDHGHEYRADGALRALAIDYIRANPGRTALLWGERLVAFWTPPVQKIMDPGTGRGERLIRLAWLAQYLLLLGLALVPLAARRPLPQLTLLYGTILLCAAAYAPFFIIYRFRLPVMVLLCLAAGWGAALLLETRRHPRTGTIPVLSPEPDPLIASRGGD